jgi:hypothetical protein
MHNYFTHNPAAKTIISDYMKLNENASVDNLLKRATEIFLDTFKKIVFDLASRDNRNPEVLRDMLLNVATSKTVKSLVAKIKDYADEAELGDSRFSKVKNMYTSALNSMGDALKRLVEVDSKLEDGIINTFKISANRLISSLDSIAVGVSKKKSTNESSNYEYNYQSINESAGIGFTGRIEKLRKKLVNLISDSKGKDSKNGYGRDWQRLFTALEQKLEAIENSKDITGEKDRKTLSELEKQTDSLSEEYYNYKIKAAEMSMKKIIDDDELITKYSDVTEIITSALDLIAKANVKELLIDKNMREEMDEMEHKVIQKVFPIKVGAKDSDLKFKKSGIIAAVQKSLMSAFPPLKTFLQKHGGADGKYGPPTSVAIKSIQSLLGNKNANGELDKPLFDSLLKMEQISGENKKTLSKALDQLKKTYAMSESEVIGIDMFSKLFEAIFIDDEELEKEIEKNSGDLANIPDSMTSKEKEEITSFDSKLAKNLAKNLRKGYNKNAEEEDFLKEDGTLKSSYPTQFVESWLKTLEENSDETDKPAFFWIQEPDEENGSLYSTKRISGNFKKPYNWSKWVEFSGGETPEDRDSFARWYTGYFSKFGGIQDDQREKVISEILNLYSNPKNSSDVNPKLEDSFISCASLYDDLKDSLKGGKSSTDAEPYEYFKRGYLTTEALKKILDAASTAAQIDDDEPDLDFYDFIILSVCVFLCSSTIAWNTEKKKWDPAITILKDKVLKERVLNKIMDSRIVEKEPKALVPHLNKDGVEILSRGYDGNSKKIFRENLNRSSKVLEPLIQRHADRINYKTKEDIKTFDSKNVFVVDFD